MLRGSKLNKYTTVHHNHEAKLAKTQTNKQPLSQNKSQPTFKEADIAANRILVQNAAMDQKLKQAQKVVQSQVQGVYFKTEAAAVQQSQQTQRRQQVSPVDQTARMTNDGPNERVSEYFQTPAQNLNKQRAPEIQINQISKPGLESRLKTTKGPFRRKAAYFKTKSRTSSASSAHNIEGITTPDTQCVVSKTETDEHYSKLEVPKTKKSCPVPLPPSNMQKSVKDTAKKANQSKRSMQTRSQAEIDISYRKTGNHSPNAQLELILSNKPPAVLKPKHFEIFTTQDIQSQTPFKDSEQSSQPISRLKKNHTECQLNYKQARRKTSLEEKNQNKQTLNDQINNKAKGYHLSRSRKRVSDLDKKIIKFQTNLRSQDTDDDHRQLLTKFQTTFDLLKPERQRDSTLKKFRAYRARAFGKPSPNCISQKLLSVTQKKPYICALYTPSQTLRRTYEIQGRRSSSNQNAKKTTISPNEAKRSDKKPSQSQRPFELYKNATQAILLQQVRAHQIDFADDSTQSHGKSQPSTLTPTYDQRMISYRSQPRKSKPEKRKSSRRKKHQKPIAETMERENEESRTINVQIDEKSPPKSQNQTIKAPKNQGGLSDKKNKSSQKKKNEVMDGPKYQFTLRQLEQILFSDQQKQKHVPKATIEYQLNLAHQKSKRSSDQFISIEPSTHRVFEQQLIESPVLQANTPVKDLPPEHQKNAQPLQKKYYKNLLSLVELQKLRAKNMKHLKRGAAKIKAKTDAAIKIQRWFRHNQYAKKQASYIKAVVPNPIQSIVTEAKSPQIEVAASRNEYMLEFQTKPLNTEMSSTQRVQNLIMQKIEKRHREALMDSFQLQAQVSLEIPQNLKKKVSAEFNQGEMASCQKSQPTDGGETSRRSGLIPVGHLQDDPQTSRQSRFNIPFSGNIRNGNEINTSITLSRLMLEDSLNVQVFLDRKRSLNAEPDQIDSRTRSRVKSALESRPESLTSRQKVAAEDLKQLDIATTALSPIQLKQSSSTVSLERQLREPYEEQKSLNHQPVSGNKMRRFEDKFPTPSQIQRVNSQNSLQMSGNRNHEFNYLPQNSSNRPSKLIYTCGSGSSMLASQSQSGMICSQVSQESPVCQRLIHDGLFKPLESQNQLFFSPMSEMQVHVEDQHNDSQQSFQNEDSKSDSFNEAPFEKSNQDIQRSQIIQLNDRQDMPTNELDEQPHSDNQEQDESQNTVNPPSQQQSEKTVSAHAQSEYTQEGITTQQREISQSGVSPYSANIRASNSNTGESSSSINDSAAPCSGAIQSRTVRQQIETRPAQRELNFIQDKAEIENDCRAPDNSLIRTTPDPLSIIPTPRGRTELVRGC